MLIPFIIHIPVIILLAIYLNKKFQATPLYKYYWPSLLIKLLAGIIIGLLYTYFYSYGGDTFQYHNYSVLLTDLLKNDIKHYLEIFFLNNFNEADVVFEALIIQPRVLFFVKILSLINLLTSSNYWINSLYLSLFSFLGLWSCGNALISTYKSSKVGIFLSFFILPSFVLWSSGVLKESIVVGIIGFLISIFISIVVNHKFSILKFSFFFFLFFIGWKIKFFYFAILLALMIALTIVIYLNKFIPTAKTSVKNILLLASFISLSFIATISIPSFNTHYIIDIMYISYSDMLRFTEGENYFTFHNLQPTITSYLINLPEALTIGLFRPFLWEVKGLLPVLYAIENLFITILFISAAYQIIKNKKFNLHPPVLALLIYIFTNAILMAFIAPNWGTLSRYKTGFLMFFVVLIMENNPLIDSLLNRNMKKS